MKYSLILPAIIIQALMFASLHGEAWAKEPVDVNRDVKKLPDLPLAITSFGADRLGDALYVYGGHHGRAHHYSSAGQSGDLLRLDLKNPQKWVVVTTSAKLQGLALIAHGDKLYRIGGFSALNKEGEEHNLWSRKECARFDAKTGKLEERIDMPSERSSFDAVLVEDTIYVIGGWAMQGVKSREDPDTQTEWREDALALDLSQDNPRWKAIAPPPFMRRALAVGTRDGKVYAIGGMQPDGKVTTATDVYDPETNKWSDGPKLPGADMEGFGAACCTIDNQLYVSTSSGKLLKLAGDGQSWESVGKLRQGRFFHQMLPLSASQLGVIAGAHMEEGRFEDVEIVDLKSGN